MKIIYQGKTKTGKEIIIRYPNASDVREMLRFINELSDEKTFIRYQGEHETLESETKYLASRLGEIEGKKAVHLLVFSENRLIAAAEIYVLVKTEKHIGILGITVAKDSRGDGLGKLLMELVVEEAEKEIADLKIVTLEVYATNEVAQALYKKMGFIEYGKLPNGVMRSGIFEDRLMMYKNIR
jgi:ribosomal protein S18 acetylase RimI-like enzyme